MREQVCFEHHAHDDDCFVDREASRREHLEWCRKQCESGWPTAGWASALSGDAYERAMANVPRQHRPIKIDESWSFCPLCGRQVR